MGSPRDAGLTIGYQRGSALARLLDHGSDPSGSDLIGISRIRNFRFASCHLAQPTQVCASTGDTSESGRAHQPERFVEHVLSRMPKPSRAWTSSLSRSLVELSDQEPSARFEHPVHLLDCGQLIILSDVMQDQGARERVEAPIRKRQVLRERDLEAHRYSALARPAAGALDHLGCWIDAVHRAGRSHTLSENDRKAASPAAHIEHLISGPQLKVISHHGAHTVPASPEQVSPQVVETGPVNEPVTTVVISTAGSVHHRLVSVRRSLPMMARCRTLHERRWSRLAWVPCGWPHGM
jgi:hypothetical protein